MFSEPDWQLREVPTSHRQMAVAQLLKEDFTHSLDHSSGLSEEMGRIFDSGDACDFLIVANSTNKDASEMETQTVCAHKMILSPFKLFNVSEGSESITVSIRSPCLQHFTTFIR